MENARYKILMVEDDKLDRMAFMRMVEEEELSYDCTFAASVREAKTLLGTEQFDIVICDYLLGDGTAFEILAYVKSAPVIFVTGAGNEEVAMKAWQAGAYDYVIKDHERSYLKTIPITLENAIKHQRMRSRLRLLSHAVVSTDDCVYITDLEDKITFVNRAFCQTYGYSEEEIIGQDSSILWKGVVNEAEPGSCYQANNGWEVGFLHRRKDGTQFPVSLTRSDVKDEEGNEVALVVIARDISERMEVEHKLIAQNRELTRQNRLQTELTVAACRQLETLANDLRSIASESKTQATGLINTELCKNLESLGQKIDKVRETIEELYEASPCKTAQ